MAAVDERVVDRVWASDARSARLARLALAPIGWTYAAGMALRNHAYDRGWLPAVPLALPTVAVGNLTVGGTGKTPMAAWLAAQLRERGVRPAIVLRGYGGDEPLVHARLTPGVPVITDADRVQGVQRARDEGAGVAVLDDGFQHRRARRDADVVLLSAERSGPARPLPAGPWREPLTSLRRATLVVVTRKSAAPERARELLAHVMRFAPGVPGAVVHLAPDALVDSSTAATRRLDTIAGADVLAISAIGDPRAFEQQLRALGARVHRVAHRDHHRYTPEDAAALARSAGDVTCVVCTLKDAVKLAPLWPRQAPPLWYLSQRVSVEAGQEALASLIADLVARTAPDRTTTPAPAGPANDWHGP